MKIDTALYTIKRKMTFYFLEAACLSMVHIPNTKKTRSHITKSIRHN
jgi:disulfide oxidoreductase YuzD